MRPEDERFLLEASSYWSGHLNNNLGRFADAITSFKTASDNASEEHFLECKRSVTEAKFFKAWKDFYDETIKKAGFINALGKVADELQELEIEADAVAHTTREGDNNKKRIALLRANAFFVRALITYSNDDFIQARNQYDSLRGECNSVSEFYATFGFAQACFELAGEEFAPDRTKARDLIKLSVEPRARQEFIQRVEPRSKSLSQSIVVMCCYYLNNKEDIAIETLRLEEVLNKVDGRLTVFSPVEKWNIQRDRFLDHLKPHCRFRL